jgi:hypothetical protein
MQSFISKRHRVVCDQLINSTPEKIFPLLCPQREYDWIPTWDCKMVYSESGYSEQDCVFTTDIQGDTKETWVVDRFEPNHFIQFIKFAESRVIRYSITLTDHPDGTTALAWEQTITALTEEGNHYIETFRDDVFGVRIKMLEKLLNHYLSTGEMLKP